jgi:hypothetical protein
MAGNHKKANLSWDVTGPDGKVPDWERVGIAVLMDIRHELQRLNGLLHCFNFMTIPSKLDRIGRNTAKPKRKRLAAIKKVA